MALLNESMAKGCHQVMDVSVFITRIRSERPLVCHGGRYQDEVTRREGLYSVTHRPVAAPVDDVQQFPSIVSMQFCFLSGRDTNIHKKEGVIRPVGEFIWDNSLFHGSPCVAVFIAPYKSMTNIFNDNTSIQQKIMYNS